MDLEYFIAGSVLALLIYSYLKNRKTNKTLSSTADRLDVLRQEIEQRNRYAEETRILNSETNADAEARVSRYTQIHIIRGGGVIPRVCVINRQGEEDPISRSSEEGATLSRVVSLMSLFEERSLIQRADLMGELTRLLHPAFGACKVHDGPTVLTVRASGSISSETNNRMREEDFNNLFGGEAILPGGTMLPTGFTEGREAGIAEALLEKDPVVKRRSVTPTNANRKLDLGN